LANSFSMIRFDIIFSSFLNAGAGIHAHAAPICN
jgi:hypothetical protein